MIQRYNDIVKQLLCSVMTDKVNVGAMVSPEYKNRFHKTCIDNGTTMTKVIKDAIQSYIDSHPEKDRRYVGIT